MPYKEFSVKYKDEGNGTLEGYASTWIKKPDSYGDIVAKGAFKQTLAVRWNGGKGIPLIWAHRMNEIYAFIGTANAEEDEKGLHFIAEFDGTDEAQRVRELYKDGRLSKFSFAYDILEDGVVTLEDGTKAHELRALDLFEISCVCVPANDDAGLIAVKAGKRNSKKDEDAIRQAITLLQGVLDEADENDGEDDPKDNPAGEDPKESNPEKDRLLEYIKQMNMEE